ncbi:MAG TPA: hypothetical protein VLL52_18680 [Anaerolineae bacterium]|nr:hypothetical protein [Anaerolineae bacterium]
MSIIRVPPLGKLVVVIDGQRYEDIGDIRDVKQRQRVLTAVGDLVGFVGGYQPLADAGYAPNPAPTGRPASRDESNPTEEAFLNSLKNKGQAAPARDAGNSPSVSSASTAGGSSSSLPNNIVVEVNAIIQRILDTYPQFAHHDVQVKQSVEGPLLISIDGRYYKRPNDIPDRDLQLIIKMALREWNNRR